MKATVGLVMAALLLGAAGAAAETVAGLPVHVQKLDAGALRVWLGDHGSSTATAAIATSGGIVILDTTGDPAADAELRRIIARELGRDDFRYLINTHEHGDHTGGNAVYSDCVIVGHERVAAGMATQRADRARAAEWYAARVPELEKQAAAPPADPAEAAKLREQLQRARTEQARLRDESPVPAPTRTFTDRMDLKVGDTTFELYDISGMHSASDIAVFVPRLGLLFTGDTMADAWLSDTPGCLASFMARPGVPHDFPRLLANWDRLLAKKDAVRRLLPGHWNGELSWDGFAARVEYVRALWEGVSRGAAAGATLPDLQQQYALDTRFPQLVDSPGCNRNNNASTVREMWTCATGQESAARRLYDLIDGGSDEAAVRAVVAERSAPKPKFYFLEPEINLSGYHFLQEGKTAQAVALFRVNAELFPQSWNVYDSLGEALLAAGDAQGAVAMYEKSIALNPENRNGQEALARIRGAAAQ